jgi:hypothetical protein
VNARRNLRLARFPKRHRALVISLGAALVALVLVRYQLTLLPPSLHSRSLTVGAATAEVMVAPPNLATGSEDSYVTQVDHSVLTGDIMITPPVIEYAARRLGVSAGSIQASAPMTADVPRVVTDPGSGAAAFSLVGSTTPFKLQVQADPTVPILYLYAQAPSSQQAAELASAAISGLTRYVEGLEPAYARSATATGIVQLGPIRSRVVNSGASKEIQLLVFIGIFGITRWLILIGTQISHGWTAARREAMSSRTA